MAIKKNNYNAKVNNSSSKKFLSSEWATMSKKAAINYLWYDTNLGLISKEEFEKIKL